MRYEIYFKQWGMRKVSDVRKIHPFYKFDFIPLGGVLHMGTCVNKTMSKETSATPELGDFDHYVGGKRQFYFFDKHIDPEQYVVPSDAKGIKQFKAGIDKELRSFRNAKRKLVKGIMEIPFSSATIGVVSYDPIYCGVITGRMKTLRMFNIFIAKLLTNIANNPTVDHFLLLHTEDKQYSFSDFKRTFKEHSRTTIANPDSAYYLFLMHLVGFVTDQDTPSVFEAIPKDLLSKLNIILANPDNDRSMHIRLDRLALFAEKNKAIPKQILSTINIVSKNIPENQKIGVAEESLTEIKALVGADGGSNVTGFTEPMIAEDLEKASIQQMEELDRETLTKIAEDETLSPKQKKSIATLSQEYKKIIIDGQTVNQMMTEPSSVMLEDNDVSKFVDIPDKSLTKSSMGNFHNTYVKESFKKDMVKSLVSFSSQGMFLTGLEKEVVNDDLNELTKYTATFKDMAGKQHTIKYSIPDVDEDGHCLLNGSKKSMAIQRVNTPICKVSPTRVALSSSANKTIVEKNVSFNNSLLKQIRKILDKTKLEISYSRGHSVNTKITLPHDYCTVAKNILRITGLGCKFNFDYENRLPQKGLEDIIKTESSKNVVYIGTFKSAPCYMDIDGVVHSEDSPSTRLINILEKVVTDVKVTPYNEWVNMILLNKKFPVIFLLAYRFGFETILDYLKVPYEKIPKGSKIDASASDVLVKCSDMTFVVRNPTTLQRLLVSGMNNFKLGEIDHQSLNDKDVYYTLIQQRGLSIEYIKGIDFIFDMFIDPITRDVLVQMGEPTNMRDLLIRATVLLTTGDHKEAASSANFRYRSYEQFNAILYKTTARALAQHQNKAVGHRNKFSISEFEVLKNISTDPLLNNVDVINPITEIKDNLHYTHTGDGGRTQDSMMIQDRRFPADGAGIMSEATVDSGNVGVDGVLSVNPSIVNSRGLCIVKDIKDVDNAGLLSPTTLLMPGTTMDDGKRANDITC